MRYQQLFEAVTKNSQEKSTCYLSSPLNGGNASLKEKNS